jgi:uncharacterized protein (UPF0276 family)
MPARQSSKTYAVQGAGLGLRRDLMEDLDSAAPGRVDFMEVAPENWIGVGGPMGRLFRGFTERFPFVCHGLSLSIGSPAPLDEALLHDIRGFLDAHGIHLYTEHLSFCSDDGHLYDLLPIPFTEEAVHYVADRVRRAQDILGRRIALENASYYASIGAELSELEFIQAVLTEADCDLLLDVNNIYVNSVNHGYNPEAFLKGLPGERIVYAHVAGHYNEAEDLIVDTHGADVIDSVWSLLGKAYQHFGVFPTLLERDFNFPPMDTLLGEVDTIRRLQDEATG